MGIDRTDMEATIGELEKEIARLRALNAELENKVTALKRIVWAIAYNNDGEIRIPEKFIVLMQDEMILEEYKDEGSREYVFRAKAEKEE